MSTMYYDTDLISGRDNHNTGVVNNFFEIFRSVADYFFIEGTFLKPEKSEALRIKVF